jgi:hypothetical protein
MTNIMKTGNRQKNGKTVVKKKTVTFLLYLWQNRERERERE